MFYLRSVFNKNDILFIVDSFNKNYFNKNDVLFIICSDYYFNIIIIIVKVFCKRIYLTQKKTKEIKLKFNIRIFICLCYLR